MDTDKIPHTEATTEYIYMLLNSLERRCRVYEARVMLLEQAIAFYLDRNDTDYDEKFLKALEEARSLK